MIPHERSLVERMKNEPFALIGINTDKSKDDYRKQAKDLGVEVAVTHGRRGYLRDREAGLAILTRCCAASAASDRQSRPTHNPEAP